MAEPLFKKLAYFTDIHWGRSGNAPYALDDNAEFTDWFIEEAKKRGCETFIFGGDYFDNRNQINIGTMNRALESLEKIASTFEHCWFIPGNHDLFYRDRRDVSSIEIARNLPNVTIVREPTVIGETALLPWLVGDEHKALKNLKARYVFAHLEVPGFLMNAKVEMPDVPHAVKADSLKKAELVFTGHFHMRQQKGNIVYTGNVMPFNFADAWDEERGAMFLEWGGKHEFVAWPGQPLFRTMPLSRMLNEPDVVLCKKLTARVAIDIDISYEEAQFIKDALGEEHGLRKIELVHQAQPEADQPVGDLVFQSVDQIVTDGLLSVQSNGLRPDKLVEIYRSLVV